MGQPKLPPGAAAQAFGAAMSRCLDGALGLLREHLLTEDRLKQLVDPEADEWPRLFGDESAALDRAVQQQLLLESFKQRESAAAAAPPHSPAKQQSKAHPQATSKQGKKQSSGKTTARKWMAGSAANVSKGDMAALDYSAAGDDGAGRNAVDSAGDASPFIDSAALQAIRRKGGKFEPEEMAEAAGSASSVTAAAGGFASKWLTSLRNFASDRALSHADVDAAMKSLREHLIGKNVAREVAEKLCDSVATSLIGQQVAAFQRT